MDARGLEKGVGTASHAPIVQLRTANSELRENRATRSFQHASLVSTWVAEAPSLRNPLRGKPGVLPAVAAEALLEGEEPRVLFFQGGDIGLVAVIVEPPIHDGGLLAHLLLERFPGHLNIVDLAADHPRERIGYLGHSHLVPREIHLAPGPLARVLEGHGAEDADLLDSNHLEGLSGSSGWAIMPPRIGSLI